jgi:hypothetical protein
VGVKAGANRGMGEVSFHGVLLFLRLALDSIKLDSLPFHVCETYVLGAKGVDVSDDTRVSEVEQRVVHHKSVVGAWVEDTKVGIP